jgi:hypothetical protein
MAKQLTVQHSGKDLRLDLEKVDRSKLYGFVETEVFDDEGQRCELATLNSDGNTLVGRGGAALATLSPNGLWRQKAGLKPVDTQGKEIAPVKSSFDAPIPLTQTATIDEYLAHGIHLVYKLDAEGDAAELIEELRGGKIFSFPFSYRGGLEAYAGFLLLGADGNLFLVAGTKQNFEFVGFNQPAGVVADDEEAEEEEDAGVDFGMM